MATYVYETIPKNPKEKPRRFEVEQKMSDPALKVDPTTGEPVKRVIVGGSGVVTRFGGHGLRFLMGAGLGTGRLKSRQPGREVALRRLGMAEALPLCSRSSGGIPAGAEQ